MRDFTVDQVGSRQLFVTEPPRLEAPREQLNDDAGVEDLHSPRRSCSTAKMWDSAAGPELVPGSDDESLSIDLCMESSYK